MLSLNSLMGDYVISNQCLAVFDDQLSTYKCELRPLFSKIMTYKLGLNFTF